jgi:hypothetical protein
MRSGAAFLILAPLVWAVPAIAQTDWPSPGDFPITPNGDESAPASETDLRFQQLEQEFNRAKAAAIQAYNSGNEQLGDSWVKRAEDVQKRSDALNLAIENRRNAEAMVNAYRESHGLSKCSIGVTC